MINLKCPITFRDGNPVVFRVGKSGKIIALFPEDEDSMGNCPRLQLEYKPVVTQEAVNYRMAIKMSRPATKSESQPLLDEITKIGLSPVCKLIYRKKKVKKSK